VEIIQKSTSQLTLFKQALVTLRNLVRSPFMQELQQHMITNEIIKKLEILRKGLLSIHFFLFHYLNMNSSYF